ncbi:hypothetical protein [Paracoccus aminophilus]|uniref:hypothetical protein n=1 Tax=Paracoccus aminophilus TaxID=34003 RepID=UPI00040F6E28|nr:hypothetical protein [Paracoccus aminophilus]
MLRFILAVVALGFLAFSAHGLWQISTSLGGRWLIERTGSELSAAMTRATLGDAPQPRLEAALSEELANDPRDWIVINSLTEIATAQGITLSPELQTRITETYDADHSILHTAGSCARCAWNSASCELNTAMICGIAVNLTPIGDIAGISRAGIAYASGEEVDQIDATLSVVGLGATGLALASGGSSLTVKAGAGFLKFAHLAGKIPVGLTRILRRAAAEGIDWAALPAVRGISDLRGVVRMDALRPAVDLASATGEMVARTGPRQGLYLLGKTDDLNDLRKMARASDALGEQTAGYLKLAGKSKFLRLTLRVTHEAFQVLAGLVGWLAALVSAQISHLLARTNRRLRRYSKTL